MMENAGKAIDRAIEPKERLIIALDVPTAEAARVLVAEIGTRVGAFKVGLQLFTAAGPAFVRELVDAGHRIFLDLKFHDIPNTVAAAAVEAARVGVWMLNVHAAGGSEMMVRTRDAVSDVCHSEGLVMPKLIAVTVLTSSDQQTLNEAGVKRELDVHVAELAKITEISGFDGVVASPREVGLIRRAVARKDFLVVTPGIRPVLATSDDQRRVMTFADALVAGADYLVVGRPITQAADRVAAIETMLAGN